MLMLTVRRLLLGLAIVCCGELARAQDPQRYVLTSASMNRQLQEFELTGQKVTPAKPGWSVRLKTLAGGRQEGSQLLVVDNGRIRVTLIPTRGMGILAIEEGPLRVGWQSPVTEVVHPRFMNLQSRGGLGWLEGFNEWMCRCGLESNGHPGTDKFINNVGEEATMELTLHGKIANIPASEVEVLVDPAPPYAIRVRGTVFEKSFYGPKLKLETEFRTTPGSSGFELLDTVSNLGAETQEFELLYHANFGAPLLEEGARFHAAAKSVTPFNAHAAKAVEQYAVYAAPTTSFTEEVYCLVPVANQEGVSLAALSNRAGDRGFAISFRPEELPNLTLWKNTAAAEDGYVTGIEPGTNYPNNRRIERKLGRVPQLAPRARQQFHLGFTLLSDAKAVSEAKARIDALQASHGPVQIAKEPEAKE